MKEIPSINSSFNFLKQYIFELLNFNFLFQDKSKKEKNNIRRYKLKTRELLKKIK